MVGIREKFRIRCYDGNFGFIRLEKEQSYNAGNKTQCRVTAEETQRILDGDIGWMADERALVVELYLRMQMGIYRPYGHCGITPEASTYVPGNVRTTFDRRSMAATVAPVKFFRVICRPFSHFSRQSGHGSEVRRIICRIL